MRRFFKPGLNLAALLAAALPLCACAGGFSLEKAEVDKSILTSNVPAGSQGEVNRDQTSDEVTIRNAVSSADVSSLAGAPIPWANADTGSRGSISGLGERKEGSQLCRSFTTSRESFDGVLLYQGEVCTAGQGAWRLQQFQAL